MTVDPRAGLMTDRRVPLRYLVVGAWNTVFGVVLFTVLSLTWGDQVGYAVLLSIAQVIAVVQAHATQRFLVWHSRAPYLAELGRFSLVYVGSYIANLILLALSVEVLGLPVLPSQYVITVVVICAAFLANRSWAFSHGTTPTTAPVPTGAVPGDGTHS